MRYKAIMSKNFTQAAIFILDRTKEIFQAKYTQEGKLAVKNVRHYLDQYLRSASDSQKLADLCHALNKTIPFLTQKARQKITAYLAVTARRIG
jgi:ribosome recycling factor